MAIATGAIRLAVVDDHSLFRHGLAEILGKEPDIEVTASIPLEGSAAVVNAARPDLVLLDSDLLGDRALRLMRAFSVACPDTRVIVLSMYDDPGLVGKLVAAGARGFVLKNTSRDELLSIVRGIAYDSDRVILSLLRSTLRRIRVGDDELLSAREREVLGLLAQGMRNADIAGALFITEGTVKRHLTNIYAKLGVSSRVEAMKKAIMLGLVSIQEPGKTHQRRMDEG